MTHRQHDPGDAWANALLDERTPAAKRPRAAASARTGRTWAMAVCVLSLLLGTPIAVQAAGEGEPGEGGARNPSPHQTLAFERETEIIAETAIDTYGTRQSNKGAGGGAIYGCRSTLDLKNIGDPAKSTPCIRANNLNDGKAFDLQVGEGNLGGVIQKTNNINQFFPNAAPFFTNMGGVALGLNSDRVDNMHAEQIITEAVKRAGGGGGGGTTNPNGLGAGDSGTCPAGTTAIADGCLETAPRAAANYAAASRTCAQAGRRLPQATVLLAAGAAEAINLGGGEVSSDVTTPAPADLSGPLAPLIDAVNGLLGPLGPLPDLAPLTIPGTYTRVDESGEIAGSTLITANPFRCFIA
ncbi:MAG TPA: hypothetical protein VGW11_01115 [Solirubrobacteraceae bacterium]|nr:hypothetical protein [Solirubrobacteraceae bacterium]